jgi:hypothetical protein
LADGRARDTRREFLGHPDAGSLALLNFIVTTTLGLVLLVPVRGEGDSRRCVVDRARTRTR